jgi:hypothetical protein
MINKREKQILEKDIKEAEKVILKRVNPLIEEKKKIIQGLPEKLRV